MTHPRNSWADLTATVLITYNRPWHTEQVVKALRRHRVQHLIVLCDAPSREEQIHHVQETRRVVESIDWTQPEVVYQTQNKGLAKSVLQGIELALNRFEAVILLEDDCVPQEHFFDFMYGCLGRYENDDRVFGISGYSIPIPEAIRAKYPHDLYFFHRMGSWGWATWKDRWQTDNRNLAELTIKAIGQGVDLEQGGTDVPNSIASVLIGELSDTWTLPWLVNVYLHGAYYIYPIISHIDNIGHDGTGVHCGKTDKYHTFLAQDPCLKFPESPFLQSDIVDFFRAYQASPFNQINTSLLGSLAKNKLLKVLHVCTLDHGGAGIAALRLHKGLKNVGVSSSMLVLSKQSNDPDVHRIGKGDFFDRNLDQILAPYPNHRKDLEIFSDGSSDLDLCDNHIFAEADIVHFHWVSGMVNHSELNRMLNGKPAVWTLHDMNPFTGICHYDWGCQKYSGECGSCPQLGSTDEADISRQSHQLKSKGYLGSNLHIASPSTWLAQEARRSSLLGAFPIYIIPNGFPLDIFKPLPVDIIRKHLGIGLDRKVILFGCESLSSSRKGFKHLLEAFTLLMEDGQEAPLLCFFGHLPSGLKLPGDTKPLGTIRDPNILAAIYSMADVFVISSLQDNLPNVVPESLACGTPVVGFRTGGISEMIEHKRTGCLVETGNSQELAIEIRWVLNHNKAEMRRDCRLFAESNFNLSKQVANYLSLYERIHPASHATQTM